MFDHDSVCRRAVGEVEIMSVALDWQPSRPGRTDPRRAHLSLVPPLPEARPARGGLTRRGRLARTLLVFTVLVLVALHLADPPPAPADLSVDHVATVQAGQSLTEVALQELPALGVEEGVRRIRLVNDLQSTGLYPGQSLRIPVNR